MERREIFVKLVLGIFLILLLLLCIALLRLGHNSVLYPIDYIMYIDNTTSINQTESDYVLDINS